MGSFLRSAATTAAGVAAGALAFEGIESLFGHGGGWGGGGLGSGAPVVDETVINNYYDDPKQGSFAEHHEQEASFDDRPEGRAELKDASYPSDTDTDTSSLGDPQDDSQTDDFDSGLGDGDNSDFV